MESKRWFYKVTFDPVVSELGINATMRLHDFRSVRVETEDGFPVAYGEWTETEDDDVGGQDDVLWEDDNVVLYERQRRPFGDEPAEPALREYWPGAECREKAMLIGMEFGIDAYNEAMGNA